MVNFFIIIYNIHQDEILGLGILGAEVFLKNAVLVTGGDHISCDLGYLSIRRGSR